jgi:precorrin-3B C17-methyltransferase
VTGRLAVLGLGPGPADWITPEASGLLAAASDIVGYRAYVARVAAQPNQRVHASDNGDELARARLALELAVGGARVAVVSGGDPGVFAMASAVFEAIEHGPAAWRELEVTVCPGVTAMLAAAARLGAPLGADFCAINLSDNLKPWSVVEQRLTLAARADFVLALYNPASKARPEQVHHAFAVLRAAVSGERVVAFATAVGRPDESFEVTTLAEADPSRADMRTLIVIGSSGTRLIERGARRPFVYSSRRWTGPPAKPEVRS